jgi:hypothetical protein
MNFGDLMGLFIAMGGMVAIVAVIGNSYRHRLSHKLRLAELRANSTGQANADQSADHVERLENRIRVLERIATDKSTTLATQIENLREPAN